MDETTKIALIVAGLPFAVQERLDRGEIDTVSKLLAKINLLNRSPRSFLPSSLNFRFNKNSFEHNIAKKKGFPGCHHTEAKCKTQIFR